MFSLSVCATVLLLGWQPERPASDRPSVGPASVETSATIIVADIDSLRPAPPAATGPTAAPVGLTRRAEADDAVNQDTVPRRRAKAIEYSDAYYKRLTLHRTLSWAMLPLFAVSYASGDQLLSKGDQAPGWAKSVHPVAATSTAVLFGANAITGGWNLWDGRKDPNGRTRRLLHSALFLAASGGFAYAGSVLADEAEESASKRRDHRTMALSSMGMSTASWLIMLIGN